MVAISHPVALLIKENVTVVRDDITDASSREAIWVERGNKKDDHFVGNVL